jgi:hypothetical protein
MREYPWVLAEYSWCPETGLGTMIYQRGKETKLKVIKQLKYWTPGQSRID